MDFIYVIILLHYIMLHYIIYVYTDIEKLPCKFDSVCMRFALAIVQGDIILKTTHKILWHTTHNSKVVKSQSIFIYLKF